MSDQPMTFKVKRISDDSYWSYPRLKNIETGKIYADVSLGESECYPYFPNGFGQCPSNIPGAWHTVTQDGEPDCPLNPNVIFELIEN